MNLPPFSAARFKRFRDRIRAVSTLYRISFVTLNILYLINLEYS